MWAQEHPICRNSINLECQFKMYSNTINTDRRILNLDKKDQSQITITITKEAKRLNSKEI